MGEKNLKELPPSSLLQSIMTSVFVGLTIQKTRCESTIIKVSPDGIMYSIGMKGNCKKLTVKEIAQFCQLLQEKKIVRQEDFKQFILPSRPCNKTTLEALLQRTGIMQNDHGTWRYKA